MGLEKDRQIQQQDKKRKHHGKKSGGDYDGWILRLIDKVEELNYAANLSDWWTFAESKINGREVNPQTYSLTDAQKEVLAEKRLDIVFDVIPNKLGIGFERPFRGTDIVRFRNTSGGYGQRKGTWVSAAKLNASITEQKEAKTWTKL